SRWHEKTPQLVARFAWRPSSPTASRACEATSDWLAQRFSPDGRYLITSASSLVAGKGCIQVWDLDEKGRKVSEVELEHSTDVVLISPHGRYLAASAAGT